MGLYTSDIAWVRGINSVHEGSCYMCSDAREQPGEASESRAGWVLESGRTDLGIPGSLRGKSCLCGKSCWRRKSCLHGITCRRGRDFLRGRDCRRYGNSFGGG